MASRGDAVQLAPSLLSADLAELGAAIRAAEDGGADAFHVDVMDGRFVPNISFGASWVAAIRRRTRLPLDIHLMIEAPERYLAAFAEAGGSTLVVHFEATRDVPGVRAATRRAGVGMGIAIRPETPVAQVEPFLASIDELIVMSVHPGFSGQQFLPEALPKLRAARAIIDRDALPVELSVDGGITLETVREASRAGANFFVCGNSVFARGPVKENLTGLRAAAEVGRRERREVR